MKFSSSGAKDVVVHQGHLQIQQNARKQSNIKDPCTGTFLEFDFWIKKLNLCFEFQDEYHYTTTWYTHLPLEDIQNKDRYKHEKIKSDGITVVVIPCWWNGSVQSLEETIIFQRPDIKSEIKSDIKSDITKELESINQINFNPPRLFFQRGGVPGVGELMLASFPNTTSFSISPQNPWWLGEKYDGIRICWNPVNQQNYTRSGGLISLPESFTVLLPNIFLDGEIWFGRGAYNDVQRLIKSLGPPLHLHYLRLIAFDSPNVKGDFPFEERYHYVISNISIDHSFLTIAARKNVTSAKYLATASKDIIDDGGEGVILRKPKSFYESGRSSSLLKIKAAQGDKEAIVVDIDDSFTVTLKMPEGIEFTVPREKVVSEMPEIGDIVSFSYDSFARRAAPVNSTIFRIRKDVDWDEVVRNYESEILHPVAQEEHSRKSDKKELPQRYWTSKKGSKMRAFFEEYARKYNLDPLDPETWYNTSRQAIESEPGGTTVLGHFKGGYVNTLMQIFPDIGLEESQFDITNQHWHSATNRRAWFDAYAARKGFDPLVPDNWYSCSTSLILQEKGASAVLRNHKNSAIHSIVQLYPEIGLDPQKFISPLYNDWESEEARRNFFIELASEMGFDPYNPYNWYKFTRADAVKKRGAWGLLGYYGGSLGRALVSLFPDIGLVESKCAFSPAHWKDPKHRREFFEAIAQEKGFDSLVAENWYSLSTDQILSYKGGVSVLRYHKGFVQALLDLFPDIGIQSDKFSHQNRHFWSNVDSRRKFLTDVAHRKGQDPLIAETWYNMTKKDFLEVEKDSSKTIQIGRITYTELLEQVFPEIAFDKNKFKTKPAHYWESKVNRRMFFEKIAKENGFDPLVPTNWYFLNRDKIIAEGGSGMLKYVNGSFITALQDAFPGIGVDRNRFSVLPRNYWLDESNRRKFFIDYAGKKNFNPYDPNEWYSVSLNSLSAAKGAYNILKIYDNSFGKALQALFPQLNWDISKLKHSGADCGLVLKSLKPCPRFFGSPRNCPD